MHMAVIPVICNSCKAVWFHKRIFGLAGLNNKIITKGCITNPRPSCGTPTTIPDGTYESLGYQKVRITLANREQYDLVVAAIQEIQQLISIGVPPEVIVATIDTKYPFLSYLKKFLPKDFKDLVIVVGFLGAMFQYMKPNQVAVPQQAQPEVQGRRKSLKQPAIFPRS